MPLGKWAQTFACMALCNCRVSSAKEILNCSVMSLDAMHLDQGMDRAGCMMKLDETVSPIWIGCKRLNSLRVLLMSIFGGVRMRPCHAMSFDVLRAEGHCAARRNPRLRAGNPWQAQGQCINKIFAHVSPQRAPNCCISAIRPGCRPLLHKGWAIKLRQFSEQVTRCHPAL